MPYYPPNQSEELREILSEPDVWDWGTPDIEVERSYSAIRWEWAKRRFREAGPLKVIGLALLPPVIAIALGISADSLMKGLLAGAIVLVVEVLLIYLFYIPKEIHEALQGTLRSAQNQILEEKRKTRRAAEIAKVCEQSYFQCWNDWQKAQKGESEAQRELTEARDEIANLKQRPEITGGFHDILNSYYYDETILDQELPPPIGTQVVLSVWLRNNNPTSTTLHNFKLQWEERGKTWLAPYAEEVTIHHDRDIWPTQKIAERNQRMVNLSSYLGSKSFTKDVRVEGYLVFRLAGHGIHVEGVRVEDLPQEGWPITITLYIEDAWGTEHVIRDPMFTHARPSLTLSEKSTF